MNIQIWDNTNFYDQVVGMKQDWASADTGWGWNVQVNIFQFSTVPLIGFWDYQHRYLPRQLVLDMIYLTEPTR